MSAFRAALRIARRDASRHRGRSLLVIALIGLPVLVLAGVDVGWRTYQLNPEQRLTREIGAADVAVQSPGMTGDVDQTPRGWLGAFGSSGGPDGTGTTTPPGIADLTRTLPRGSRLITMTQDTTGLNIRTQAGVQYAPLTGFDYADPIAAGMITQVSGRAPRTASEVALTTHLAKLTGLTVGETLHTYDGKRALTVVGTVHSMHGRNVDQAYTAPSGVTPEPTATEYLVDTPAPFTWSQVRELNKLGFIAIAREPFLNPPPKSQIPDVGDSGARLSTSAAATIGLIAGMALLEVVLLAGPAFAVSARRQRRDLALVAATGGRRGDLRNIVLANGLVLGLAAGLIGAVLGVGLLAAAIGLFGGRLDQFPGPFDVRPLELAGLALISLVTAVLASLVPAITAARTDVVAALAGRRGQTRIKRRVPVIGLIITAVGVVVALAGAGANRNVNLILAGVVITEFGLIVLAPTLITLAAMVGRWLPFAPRLALRDASRNRASAAPAVAAIMAATIGAIAITLVAASQTDLDRRNYTPEMSTNAAYVDLRVVDGPAGQQPSDSEVAVAAALKNHLATTQVAAVRSLGRPACTNDPAPSQPCKSVDLQLDDPDGNGQSIGTSRYRGGMFDSVVVDDGSAVSALFGVDLPEAEAALRAGHVVVSDSGYVHDGMVSLWAVTDTEDPGNSGLDTSTSRKVTVPGVAVERGFPAAILIVPPALATELAGPPSVDGVIALLAHRPTTAERQATNEALADLGPFSSNLVTEDGFSSSSEWALWVLVGAAGLITLGAAAVATALANVDGRADLVTLGAVGAAPRTRRVVSASRAGVIAALGCLVGTAAGFVPAIAWIRHQANQTAVYSIASQDVPNHLRLVIQWPLIAVAAVGVPLLAMLLAGTFTRSRLPSERRVD